MRSCRRLLTNFVNFSACLACLDSCSVPVDSGACAWRLAVWSSQGLLGSLPIVDSLLAPSSLRCIGVQTVQTQRSADRLPLFYATYIRKSSKSKYIISFLLLVEIFQNRGIFLGRLVHMSWEKLEKLMRRMAGVDHTLMKISGFSQAFLKPFGQSLKRTFYCCSSHGFLQWSGAVNNWPLLFSS